MPKRKSISRSLLQPTVSVVCAGLFVIASVVLMLGYGGSWLSVIAGCSLFALGVRLAETGIGFCLYRERHSRMAEPQESLPD